MAVHIQVNNYADFNTVVNKLNKTVFAANPGQVFYQNITGGTLAYVWWLSADGNWIVSNCAPAAGSAAFTPGGLFLTGDFTPTPVAITAAGATVGSGQVASPGLTLAAD